MASRRTDRIAHLEAPGTAAALVWHMIHDRVHLIGGDQRARVARVARLAAALDATTALPLITSKTIRRQRFRGDDRILLAQRELALQIINLARLVGNPFRAFLKLLLQPLILPSQPLYFLRRRTPLAGVALVSLRQSVADSVKKYRMY
jgi:hypothetical protein